MDGYTFLLWLLAVVSVMMFFNKPVAPNVSSRVGIGRVGKLRVTLVVKDRLTPMMKKLIRKYERGGE